MKHIYTLLIIIPLVLLGFSCCSDDKNDDNNIVEPIGKIVLSEDIIKLYTDKENGFETSVKIVEGGGDYKIIGNDNRVVDVSLKDNIINVKGPIVGTTSSSFVLMDKDNNVRNVRIEQGVSELILSEKLISLEVLKGKKETVKIKIEKGSSKFYHTTKAENKLVDVKIEGETIYLTNKGGVEGKITLNFTDRMGNMANIDYEVKERLKPFSDQELKKIMQIDTPKTYKLEDYQSDDSWQTFTNNVENGINTYGYGYYTYVDFKITFPGAKDLGMKTGATLSYVESGKQVFKSDNLPYFEIVKNDGKMIWVVYTYSDKNVTMPGYFIDTIEPELDN